MISTLNFYGVLLLSYFVLLPLVYEGIFSLLWSRNLNLHKKDEKRIFIIFLIIDYFLEFLYLLEKCIFSGNIAFTKEECIVVIFLTYSFSITHLICVICINLEYTKVPFFSKIMLIFLSLLYINTCLNRDIDNRFENMDYTLSEKYTINLANDVITIDSSNNIYYDIVDNENNIIPKTMIYLEDYIDIIEDDEEIPRIEVYHYTKSLFNRDTEYYNYKIYVTKKVYKN